MRPSLFTIVAVAAIGCRAELVGGGSVDGATSDVDAPRFGTDAPAADASTIDARPCTGGDASGVAPDGSCLVHVFAPLPYADAKAACAAMGAHLAYLKDASIDAFAEQLIGTRDTFIGLSDLTTEMTFVWDDGTTLVFSAWHAGEPNDGDDTYDEDCGIIAGARVGKLWDDRPCGPTPLFPNGGQYSYLCQY